VIDESHVVFPVLSDVLRSFAGIFHLFDEVVFCLTVYRDANLTNHSVFPELPVRHTMSLHVGFQEIKGRLVETIHLEFVVCWLCGLGGDTNSS